MFAIDNRRWSLLIIKTGIFETQSGKKEPNEFGIYEEGSAFILLVSNLFSKPE